MSISKTVVGTGMVAIMLVITLWLGTLLYSQIPAGSNYVPKELWYTYDATNGTRVPLQHDNIISGSQTVTNNTSVAAINGTDYTLYNGNGTIYALNTATLGNMSYANISYKYSAHQAAEASVYGYFLQASVLMGVGIIIAAVMVIIAVVMKSMGGLGGRKND